MPPDDKTPPGYMLPTPSPVERWVKGPLRHILYPHYLRLVNLLLRRHYEPLGNLGVDQWYWGDRGLEYSRQRMKNSASLTEVRGKSVLVAGCGTGQDIPWWVPYQPSRILGVDYFNYRSAWDLLVRAYGKTVPISFIQGDLHRLESIGDQSFDIVGSDAVLEHLRNLPKALREFYRILRPRGILYASLGPLWYSWGGDHVSGYEDNASGYNHLVLKGQEYEDYLNGAGEISHSENDGRTWVKNNMFSYLAPQEYLAALADAGFEKVHLGVVLEPRATECLRRNPELKARLTDEFSEFDLLVKSLIIVHRKPDTSLLLTSPPTREERC